MEDEERAQREAYLHEELESLKISVAHLTSLLKQTLRNTSDEGPSNQPITFVPAPTTVQPEERMNEHGQEPQQNPTFVQSTTPAPSPTVMEASANESHKAKSSDSIDQAKIEALEARLKAIEGIYLYDPVRAAEMCLVPNVVIPKKFRVPEFIKYSGTQCPMTHLRSYCNKMAEQYKYNMDIAPDRTSLSNIEKKDKESIREYAQRWRELAAQVHPPLLDKEMVSLFANTLKAPYYEHMMGSSAQQFTDAVIVCERIEQGVKSGRIAAPTEKRGVERKEVHHVEDGYMAKSQIGNFQRVQEQLPPLPLPLNEMYQKLLSIGQIAPEPLTPLQPPYPNWYKPKLNCEYHAGITGHNIYTCNAFKRKLLQINQGWVDRIGRCPQCEYEPAA
ncbi:hypothetical protein D5086_008145 [Populus alba]|uniref:Uncharacterized protein n=1 Tax=Populus alba TaxID=43335 RepID=A0ACC4CH19_POPAL